jgi:PAS domain S-box-containing protein
VEAADLLEHAKTARHNLSDSPLDVWRLNLLEVDQKKLEDAGIFYVVSAIRRGAGDRTIIYTSSWIKQLTGYEASDFLGRDCRFLQGPATDRTTVSKIRDSLNKEESVRCMVLNYRKDGTPFWNLLSIEVRGERESERERERE